MQPLPFDKRVPGQRVKWSYTRDDGTVIWYTGAVVPLRDGHPLKEIAEETRMMIYVMPDIDEFPWLQGYPFCFYEHDIEEGWGSASPIYAEDEKETDD